MPKEVAILKHQNLMDITVQETGTIEALYQIALDNGISILENTPGRIIKIGETTTNIDVLRVYRKHKVVPATAKITQQQSTGAFSNGFSNGFNN